MGIKGEVGGGTTLNLLGAPDTDIGKPRPRPRAARAIRIELSHDVIRDMQRQVKAGKSAIQLLLGKSPQLRYDGKTTPLHLTPTTFRTELYERKSEESNDWNFKALITHSAAVRQAEEVTASVDAAVAQLQATMENLRKEKEENRATFIDEVKDPKKMGPGRKPPTVLRKAGPASRSSAATGRSLPASPALNASNATPSSLINHQLPARAPSLLDSTEGAAARYTIVHVLAIRPQKIDVLEKLSKIPHGDCVQLLRKIARNTPGSSSLYELEQRCYKELDVWRFPYNSVEDRQLAIDNTIRAFDRQRLSREDKLWQLLLPKEERGKGIVLSKLNLQVGTAATATGRNTPLPNPDASNGHISDAHSPPPPVNHRALLAGAGGELMGRVKNLDSMAWKNQQQHPSQLDPRAKRLLSGKSKKPIPPKGPAKRTEEKSKDTKDDEPANRLTNTLKNTVSKESRASVRSSLGTADDDSDEDDGSEPTGIRRRRPTTGESSSTATKDSQAHVGGQKRKVDTKVNSAEIIHDFDESDGAGVPASSKKDEDEPATKRPRLDHQSKASVSSNTGRLAVADGQTAQEIEVQKSIAVRKSAVQSKASTSEKPKNASDETKSLDTEAIGQVEDKNGAKAVHKKITPSAAAEMSGITGRKHTSSEIEKSAKSQDDSVIHAKDDKRSAQTAKKQPAEVKRANDASSITNKSDDINANEQAVRHHKREPSTASSSYASVSAKSTPMHRQSSSQSSISVRPSEMPKARKRPADYATSNAGPAKRTKLDAAHNRTSPTLSSSPLSDIQSVSTPSDVSSSAREPPEVLVNGEVPNGNHSPLPKQRSSSVSEHKSPNAETTTPDLVKSSPEHAELSSLRSTHRTKFLAYIHLRIAIDKSPVPSDPAPDLKAAFLAAKDDLIELKRRIRRSCIALAETEYKAQVPEGFELDKESKAYLTGRLVEVNAAYNKLHDELEEQEDKKSEEVERAAKMYAEAIHLRKILIPSER